MYEQSTWPGSILMTWWTLLLSMTVESSKLSVMLTWGFSVIRVNKIMTFMKWLMCHFFFQHGLHIDRAGWSEKGWPSCCHNVFTRSVLDHTAGLYQNRWVRGWGRHGCLPPILRLVFCGVCFINIFRIKFLPCSRHKYCIHFISLLYADIM